MLKGGLLSDSLPWSCIAGLDFSGTKSGAKFPPQAVPCFA